MEQITPKLSALKPQYSFSLMVSIGQEFRSGCLGSSGPGSPIQLQEGADLGWDIVKGFLTFMSSARLGRLNQRGPGEDGAPWASPTVSVCYLHADFPAWWGQGSWISYMLALGSQGTCPKREPRADAILTLLPVFKNMQLKSRPSAPVTLHIVRAPTVWPRSSCQTLSNKMRLSFPYLWNSIYYKVVYQVSQVLFLIIFHETLLSLKCARMLLLYPLVFITIMWTQYWYTHYRDIDIEDKIG